jgi:ubiquinone/menaquinone biosynthesis C-methylase UbiE
MNLSGTKKHLQYWKNRKIDWQKAYLSTWNHPHRAYILSLLSSFSWVSLMEIGCGGGANLVAIVKRFPNRQIGGVDVNPDAIELVRNVLKGGLFKVNSGDDVMMSDKSTDVTLTDMCLIYVGPFKIKKYLTEIKRITRSRVVLCEFHHPSFFKRWWLRLTTGYHAHDYKKLLEKQGFYDIGIYKMPDEAYPQAKDMECRYLITARVLNH